MGYNNYQISNEESCVHRLRPELLTRCSIASPKVFVTVVQFFSLIKVDEVVSYFATCSKLAQFSLTILKIHCTFSVETAAFLHVDPVACMGKLSGIWTIFRHPVVPTPRYSDT